MSTGRLAALTPHAAVLLFTLTAAAAPGEEACFACHPAPGLASRIAQGRHTTPEAESLAFKGDAHVGLECVDCHSPAATVPHPSEMPTRQCESCHSAVRAHVLDHQRPELKGKLPTCIGCHGYHGVLRPKNPESPVSHRNIPDLCLKCHGGTQESPFGHDRSVHGRAHHADPDSPAAVCTDCHSAHPEQQNGSLLTLVSHARLPATCGKCHAEVLTAYRQSIHGKAVAAGEAEAANCSDCHGDEHRILAPTDPAAQTSPQHVSQTCAKCHADAAVTRLRGLPEDSVTTYQETFHGIANRFGSLTTANCMSCHGAHDIRSASDPKSSIHPSNLPATCGECHHGVGRNVTRGRIHVRLTRDEAPAAYWVAFGFRWLTILTMAALIGHIILDLVKRVKQRRKAATGRRSGVSGDGQHVERFSLIVRIQHIVLAASTLALILTGLPLKFPDWFTSRVYFSVLGGVHVGGAIHRVGATGLILVGAFHVFWIILSAEGRRNLRALIPGLHDVLCVFTNMKWFVGLSRNRARFARFSYIEKFDYWAVYWGCVVMIGSGLVLWFNDAAMRLLPKFYLDVAREAHSDEALLATLAILIWHFYNVHLNPDHFPMNRTWLTGKITKDEMQEHHPLEYEAIMEELGKAPAAAEDAPAERDG